MKRVILAGLLAGLGLFAWESIAHMLLPLGSAGVSALPAEQAVMASLRENVRQPGLYLFPAPEDRPGMTAEQKQQAMARAQERWRAGPAGIMIVHPEGMEALSPRQLLTQFACDIAAMLLAAVLLGQMTLSGYLERVALVAAMGLFPTVQAELPNWTWYGFPTAYTLAQFVVHVSGFGIGGLVLAKVVRPAGERPEPVAARAATAS